MDTVNQDTPQTVFVCPTCSKKLAFSKVFYISKDSKFLCNHCGATLTPKNGNTNTLFIVVMFFTVLLGVVLATLVQPYVMPEARFLGRIVLYFVFMAVAYTVLAYFIFYKKIWFKVREK